MRYRYKPGYFPALQERWYVGLIAQEVQAVFPDIVHRYKLQIPGDKIEETVAIAPSELTYLLINAMKELDEQVQRYEKLLREM